MSSLLSAALLIVTAAAAPPKVPTFKAETADIRLPLVPGWKLDAYTDEPNPDIPVKGKACWNSIWFDFVPGATLAYTNQLVATESLDVTAAIRAWHERVRSGVELASRPAVQLKLPAMPYRTVFLMAAAGGTLVVQVMARGETAPECIGAHLDAADQLAAAFFTPAVLAQAEELGRTGKPPPLKEVERVPTNLEECFEVLKKNLAADDLETMRTGSEAEMNKYHHGFGTGLRNTWGLWSGSPLAKYFHAMGVFHPDDMSAIILTSFWRHLHGKPLKVEEQAAYHRRYWDVRKPPEAKRCDDGTSAVRLFLLEGRPDRFVHVFECDGGRQFWVYELDKGWSRPDEKLVKRIRALRKESGLMSAPLEE